MTEVIMAKPGNGRKEEKAIYSINPKICYVEFSPIMLRARVLGEFCLYINYLLLPIVIFFPQQFDVLCPTINAELGLY